MKRECLSRPALKFIISSSNLNDAVKFSNYFDSAQVVKVDGRRVGMHHTKAPEAERTDLATAVLTIKKLGFQELNDFDFMDPPPLEALTKSLQLLCFLLITFYLAAASVKMLRGAGPASVKMPRGAGRASSGTSYGQTLSVWAMGHAYSDLLLLPGFLKAISGFWDFLLLPFADGSPHIEIQSRVLGNYPT
ncbi:hypothetical protein Vadar_025975 [Vaccinium darrowii]|uniref:Uncharacterized protein n=1 Tax=Vaccinium darrowii TaxID=229202 RepID=A0ACB7ZED8_9ERIC|nr:hypothetical protein Vadar_025975 [Vaccinium darrowii]